MKKILLFAFSIFFITEYLMRNFVTEFKYHRVGFWLELLPIAIAAIITSIFGWKTITSKNFRITYLRISTAAILGFLTAEAITFVQWYWIIAPEYSQTEGDMQLALGWLYFLSAIAALKIAIGFLLLFLLIKTISKPKPHKIT